MKIVLNICLFLFASIAALGQSPINAFELQPSVEDYENVHVQKLYSDSSVTGFVIWIKKGVKAHYHAEHTENILILEGTGTMILNDSTFEVVAGDYIPIPIGSIHAVKVTSATPLKVLSLQSPEFFGKDRVFVD